MNGRDRTGPRGLAAPHGDLRRRVGRHGPSTLAFALVASWLVACGGGGGAKGPPMVADTSETEAVLADAVDAGALDDPPDESTVALQGNEEGAQALLQQFVAPDADHAALTRSLRPTSADYKALFDEATAPKVEAAQAKEWDSGKAVIKPKANQTEVKVWSATGADIAAGKGNAKEFPGGYKKVGKHLAADVTFFRFKFVEAGKDVGTAYDGLAFVNGHWVIAPKPWKALEAGGKASADKDDDDSGDAPAPKPKPKPKRKKRK